MADFDITLRLALLAKTVLAGSWLAPDAIAEDANDARAEIERLLAIINYQHVENERLQYKNEAMLTAIQAIAEITWEDRGPLIAKNALGLLKQTSD